MTNFNSTLVCALQDLKLNSLAKELGASDSVSPSLASRILFNAPQLANTYRQLASLSEKFNPLDNTVMTKVKAKVKVKAVKPPKPVKPPIGLILYEGASMLDDSPIVVIATLNSANSKTGNMVQTWIIRTDINPVEAVNTGKDSAICGACPHRPSLNGACYVNVGQAPNSIYKSYWKGNYAAYNPEQHDTLLTGRAIRIGAYGDPAAAPVDVWSNLATLASITTGYTHQLKHKSFDRDLLNYVMVSADTPRQALAAHKEGLRTFRVRTSDSPLLANEIECLSDSKGINCIDCGLCDSATSDKVNIAVTIHGTKSKRYIKKYGAANVISSINI